MNTVTAMVYRYHKPHRVWRATIDLNGVRVEQDETGQDIEVVLTVQQGDLINYFVAKLNDHFASEPCYTPHFVSDHRQYRFDEGLDEIKIRPRYGGYLKGRLQEIKDLSRISPPPPKIWRSRENEKRTFL